MDDALRPAAPCAPKKRVPDFFMVGHPKCGTTALYEMLRRHPQIYMPDAKEPNFFATDLYDRPDDGALKSWGPDMSAYLSLFDAAGSEQHIGEASTTYLWSRTAADGIAAVQPTSRIIAILREPASFLRSVHLQAVQSHFESERDFGKSLALEDDRRQGRHIPSSLSRSRRVLWYSDYVRYVEQLRRYHNLFPPEHVLVLIYDDLRRDNEATVRKVLRFLDVDDTSPIDVTKANPSVRVRSQYVNRMLDAITMGRGPVPRAVKVVVKASTPRKMRHRAVEATYDHIVYGKPHSPDEMLVSELRHRFKPEVVALSKYLDRDLVSLWGYNSID